MSAKSKLSSNWRDEAYERYVSSGQYRPRSTTSESKPFVLGETLVDKFLSTHSKDIRIVDLGCGDGRLLGVLRQKGYNNLAGVDMSGELVERARELGFDDVKQEDAETFLRRSSEEIDVIFAIDLLEHLTKAELFSLLESAFASLKPGGLFIGHVPNGEGMFGLRIRYGDITHEGCFTQSSIRQAFRLVGFNNVQAFEDTPPTKGVKGMTRGMAWQLLTVYPRLLLWVETGCKDHILSQNLHFVASKE